MDIVYEILNRYLHSFVIIQIYKYHNGLHIYHIAGIRAARTLKLIRTQDLEMFGSSIQQRRAGSQPEHRIETLAFILLTDPNSIVGR